MLTIPAPHRLRLDGGALVGNWRALAAMAGPAACGAAVKADGYGLGAQEVVARLAEAGCRDFYVATWAEAAALDALVRARGVGLSVLHGVRDEDMRAARELSARPVLNTPAQVARWRAGGAGRPCDVMVDTGMNRLGLAPEDAAALVEGLAVDTLMSHLASADEDSPLNDAQCRAFSALKGQTAASRMSLANSAGIALGRGYAFDLVRPGIALYGGVPTPALADVIRPVAAIEAVILQCRMVRSGDVVGYNALWTATVNTPVGIVNLGYADGYPRAMSNRGAAFVGDNRLPVVGRVSMDLIALDLSSAPQLCEGDEVHFPLDLPALAALSGRSQYEWLTGLGKRAERVWK